MRKPADASWLAVLRGTTRAVSTRSGQRGAANAPTRAGRSGTATVCRVRAASASGQGPPVLPTPRPWNVGKADGTVGQARFGDAAGAAVVAIEEINSGERNVQGVSIQDPGRILASGLDGALVGGA